MIDVAFIKLGHCFLGRGEHRLLFGVEGQRQSAAVDQVEMRPQARDSVASISEMKEPEEQTRLRT
jgi:hypothetical protein